MSGQEGKIFNVEEPKGADLAKFETTAAEAQFSAPNTAVAQQIEVNAESMEKVAEQAAAAAAAKGSDCTGNKSLGDQLSDTTNAAVSQGQSDVGDLKATGQTYLDQAKSLAGSAYTTAQGYVQSAQTAAQPHIDAATAAIQPHLESAQAAVQPHLQTAQAAVQPHLEKAQSLAQPTIDKAKEYIGAPTDAEEKTGSDVV